MVSEVVGLRVEVSGLLTELVDMVFWVGEGIGWFGSMGRGQRVV